MQVRYDVTCLLSCLPACSWVYFPFPKLERKMKRRYYLLWSGFLLVSPNSICCP